MGRTQSEVLARVHEPLSVLDALEVNRTMHSWSLDAALQYATTKTTAAWWCCSIAANRPKQLLAQFDGTARSAQAPSAASMDLRSYGVGAQILRECGVQRMRLMGTPAHAQHDRLWPGNHWLPDPRSE
jgi:3,4-dihydroxy 2-butanone 4-phosphate synthase / GTP cyclohydrolase II